VIIRINKSTGLPVDLLLDMGVALFKSRPGSGFQLRKIFVFLLSVFFVALLSAGGQQDSGGEFKYPTKTIELIGTAPGGDSDLFPRITAKYLEKLWGVTITMNVTERTLALK
jgi:hypothetical protein